MLCSEVRLFPASIKTTAGTKWGFINEKGEFVITPQFDKANQFQKNGLAIVEINERAGVIDETGSYVVHPIYQFIEPYSEGLAVVGEIGGMMRVIDESGRVRTKAYSIIRTYRDSRAVFWEKENMNSPNVGYLDHEGRVVIPPQYMNASDFSSGKALVKRKDKSYALIGWNGEILQTYPFQRMGELSEGLLSFAKNDQGLTGYVNESGMIVISPAFLSGSPFYQGRAVVSIAINNHQQVGLIDKAGAFIIPPEYDEIIMLGENRAAVGKAHDPSNIFKGAVYAIADTESGRLFTDFIYDHVDHFQGEYSSVTKGLYSFFIKKNGVPAATLPIIAGLGSLKFEGDVAIASIDGRPAYYDRHGNLIYAENTMIPLTETLSVREEKFRYNRHYLVYYPQIQGMREPVAQERVNLVLKNESLVGRIDNEESDFSYTGDFAIRFFQKNLLVFELFGERYTYGAMHGMPRSKHIHVDVQTGEVYQLKNLFKQGSNYVRVLNEMIEKQIKETPNFYFSPEHFTGIKEKQSFYVKEDELVIYFPPYEIASYAQGFPEFEIPFQRIKTFIDETGAFWRSFH